MEHKPVKLVHPTWKMWGSCLVVSASEIANGFDIGVFSMALMYFEDDLEFSTIETAIIVGMFNLVAGLGCLLAGPSSDYFGRKTNLMGGNVLNICGTLITCLNNGFPMMFCGRFIMGLGSGVAFLDPELYNSEISPAHLRGYTCTFPDAFINAGILLGYCVGWACGDRWRLMIGLGIVTPTIVFICQIFIPESPRWLVKKGRVEEAKAALRLTGDYSEEALDEIVHDIQRSIEGEIQTCMPSKLIIPWKMWQSKVVGWGAAVFQQANASEGIVYFTPTIMEMAGITNKNVSNSITAGVGFCKFFFVLVAMYFVETLGRKKLILFSSVGCAYCLLLLCFAFQSDELEFLPNAANTALIAFGVCAFMSSFSFGWGPMVGIYLPEAFPLSVRGQAVGIGWALNRWVSGTVGLTFLPLTDAIGTPYTMLLFFTLTMISFVFAKVFLPETAGVELEKINDIIEAQVGLSENFSERKSGVWSGGEGGREEGEGEGRPLSMGPVNDLEKGDSVESSLIMKDI